jgi:formylglycine-generating enzyme required for sulfatase activity
MKPKISLSLVGLIFAYQAHANPQISCAAIFSNVDHGSQVALPREVKDLKSFGQAMTEGMLLHPGQTDLFEVYRKLYFGDPNTSVNNSTLTTVTDILKKHPELEKPHFREYEIKTVEKIYETPEALSKLISSQSKTAGQMRSNLFQIEANIGFWKKILDYEDPVMPQGLDKNGQRVFKLKVQARFMRYLDAAISPENRLLLVDPKADYKQKIMSLYGTLNYIRDWQIKRGRNSQAITDAMVDLVHTSGFNNQATVQLLKSPNALDKLEGLKKIFDERDAVAMDLGFDGHFIELEQRLGVNFPSVLGQERNWVEVFGNLEAEILRGNFTTKALDAIRVRSLSIQESPFRSCLGGSDCSSRTYFSKALDPNYNYFTMTDSQGQSSGHVTVVLGTAKDPKSGATVNVAFVDKLQNVPNGMIPNFLEAVSLALSEKGYLLGVPEDVGDHNGLSNVDTTRHFVAQDVVPKLKVKLNGFVPHVNQYNFQNTYSRAYTTPSVRIFEKIGNDPQTEISAGKNYQSFIAPKDLDKNQLIQDFLNLKKSTETQDVLKYISSGRMVSQFEKLGLYTVANFAQDLAAIVSDARMPFQVRKAAFMESLLLESDSNKPLEVDFSSFSDEERVQASSEIRQWAKSSDKRKKNFANSIGEKWFEGAKTSNTSLMESLLNLKLIDLNQRNESGYTALIIATQNREIKAVEFLLAKPGLNSIEADEKGFTAVDHALALGHEDIARMIEERRPETRAAVHLDRLSQIHQTMVFQKIEPGKFMMGDGTAKHEVKLTKPFEFMSTAVTQKMWTQIMGSNPSHFKDGEGSVVINIHGKLEKIQPNHPVENVSYEDIQSYVSKLNELSKRNDPVLAQLIPGHKHGDQYRLPTEAEWEFVARDRASANGAYSFGDIESQLADPGWWEWVSDWYGNLGAATDPRGPNTSSNRVIRSGGWSNDARGLRTGKRSYWWPSARGNDVGFRLVRTAAP